MIFFKTRVLEAVHYGSLQHILPIVLALVFAIILIRFSNRKLNKSQQQNFFHGLGIFVSLTVLLFHIYLISKGNYSLVTDLPLYLCSFLALFIFIFTYYRKYWMYEILLFWILAGTSQAILTPDISEDFPSFEYIRYWIAHLGLIIIIIYATSVFKMLPTLKSVFKSFLAIQIFFVFSLLINYALDANYSYLSKKPNVASVLDYLGDWPKYIIVVEALLIPYFLIIYLPFYIIKTKAKV